MCNSFDISYTCKRIGYCYIYEKVGTIYYILLLYVFLLLFVLCKEERMNTVSQDCQSTDNDQEDWTKHGKYDITCFQAIINWVSISGKCPEWHGVDIPAHWSISMISERIIDYRKGERKKWLYNTYRLSKFKYKLMKIIQMVIRRNDCALCVINNLPQWINLPTHYTCVYLQP